MSAETKKCVFSVDDRVFCKEAALKASYMFIDDYYISVGYDEEHIISISMEAKSGCDHGDIEKEFKNELIAQMVRYNLTNSNRAMKDLIIGRALFSTCLDTEGKEKMIDDNTAPSRYSVDDIATNWFDVYES